MLPERRYPAQCEHGQRSGEAAVHPVGLQARFIAITGNRSQILTRFVAFILVRLKDRGITGISGPVVVDIIN